MLPQKNKFLVFKRLFLFDKKKNPEDVPVYAGFQGFQKGYNLKLDL